MSADRQAVGGVEEAVRRVEETEVGVAKAKARLKDATSAAHEQRNTAIATAARDLEKAKRTFADKERAAVDDYTKAIAAAKTDVDTAQAAYQDACAVAEPLLQALKATTDRISAVAGLRRS